MKDIIFISKDALRRGALPVYGNDYWKTPNIDELASKGTVFERHYTAGGSTAMAFTAMALGKYCYETDRKLYDGKESAASGNTLFDDLYDCGYDVNIAWDDSYTSFAKTHFKCEGKHTVIHSLKGIKPSKTYHTNGEFDDLTFKDQDTERALELIENLADNLSQNRKKPIFLWLHLPHVIAGRNSYESDIDVFDRVIGIFRKKFDDDSIYISADHGHMNGNKGKFGYGYDLEETVMNIPLITPKFKGLNRVDFITTAIQMGEIFGIKEFKKRETVICETAYYLQPWRKVAIVHDNYKLIYDKKRKKYSLYDLKWDKAEELNLYYPEYYDVDRQYWHSANQRFYYPYWDEAFKEKEFLNEYISMIWKNGTFIEEFQQKLLRKAKLIVSRMLSEKKKKNIVNIGK